MKPAVRKLLREPLLQFLLVGGLLLGADTWRNSAQAPESSAPPIVVPAARVEALSGDGKSTAAVQAGIQTFVEEEALLHEARRLGLDLSDLIVRRRLLQKMEFVLEDRESVGEPSDDELRAWLEAHEATYREAPHVSFEHRFFSRARRGEAARAAAEGALANPLTPGDDFMAGAKFDRLAAADVARRFGADAATAIASLPVAPGWQGPIASAHGWHVVRVTARGEGGSPAFAPLRPRLRADWRSDRRGASVALAKRALVARHRVVVEAPPVAARADNSP